MESDRMPGALGAFIRIKREEKDWSLEDLATNAGLSVDFLAMLENGTIKTLDVSTRAKLAETLLTNAALLEALEQKPDKEPPEGFPTLEEILKAAGFEPERSDAKEVKRAHQEAMEVLKQTQEQT